HVLAGGGGGAGASAAGAEAGVADGWRLGGTAARLPEHGGGGGVSDSEVPRRDDRPVVPTRPGTSYSPPHGRQSAVHGQHGRLSGSARRTGAKRWPVGAEGESRRDGRWNAGEPPAVDRAISCAM